jgi:N,N-dimethylformamidase
MDRPELSGRATADMTIRMTPDGGSVFSVGSISWTGSLSHDSYGNAVSRITENVIRAFSRSPRA